jgi:hypothetical protein
MGFFISNGVFMLKKTTIAVLGLALSNLATAGTMGPVCTPGNVTVPCETRLWDFGADALYLKSIYGSAKGYQRSYNPVTYNPLTGLATAPMKDVKNDWNWGFRIAGAYHFNTGNDVAVNWMHFSTTGKQANILAPLVESGFLLSFPASIDDSNRLDQVNIVLGQHVDLSARDKMRLYGGMQYANIQSMAQTFFYPNAALATVAPVSIFNNTDYKGFGPTLGIDYSYELFNGLSLTANGSGALLYGTSRYHEGFVVTPFNAIAAQVYARKKAVVPSLEAKLGLNYAYNFAQATVNIDAGYQAVNYFNALSTQVFQVPTNPQISSVNYGLFGPYFGMKIVGNA